MSVLPPLNDSLHPGQSTSRAPDLGQPNWFAHTWPDPFPPVTHLQPQADPGPHRPACVLAPERAGCWVAPPILTPYSWPRRALPTHSSQSKKEQPLILQAEGSPLSSGRSPPRLGFISPSQSHLLQLLGLLRPGPVQVYLPAHFLPEPRQLAPA